MKSTPVTIQLRSGWRAYCRKAPYKTRDARGNPRTEFWLQGWKDAAAEHQGSGKRPSPLDAKAHYPNPDESVNLFNKRVETGATVTYWTGLREGPGRVSTTRTPAQVLGGHTAVVWVMAHSACIALSHIEIGDTVLEKATP